MEHGKYPFTPLAPIGRKSQKTIENERHAAGQRLTIYSFIYSIDAMNNGRLSDLVALLRSQGAISAAQIGAALDISQPTVSRLLAAAGDAVVRIGRARASRYALSREVGRAGSRWPLFRITSQGQTETLGHLHALHGDGYLFVPEGPCPAYLHGEFATGLFPGLPWFLDDQRPQGFLGRAFAGALQKRSGLRRT
jgi:hypothetical protein